MSMAPVIAACAMMFEINSVIASAPPRHDFILGQKGDYRGDYGQPHAAMPSHIQRI
jgi:hypothetical protein